VIDILRRYTPSFLLRRPVARQVINVLSRILLCRTAILKGHVYECPTCHARRNVYNSCVDRHCPQCGGARRADWLDKTSALLLPQVNYFQVIFTLPDRLSSLILGNRRILYNLLFQAAWQALHEMLRATGQFQPAAQLVLHTWNQRLDHHPHIHALVPGGGPARHGQQWINSHHPTQRRRRKPFLVDNRELGRRFRAHYIEGLRRLARNGKLRLEGAWSKLQDPEELEAWLDELTATDWNVFIEGPPKGKSDPKHVLKYLARYMTGGPISDRRLISDENGVVTFWARGKDKANGNQSVPYALRGNEFVRRWAMHILPKGFTRARGYGGYHGAKRGAYLERCRALLGIASEDPRNRTEPLEQPERGTPTCVRCEIPMACIDYHRRPSWQQIFQRDIYADPAIYSPMHHIHFHTPPANPVDEYG